MAPQLAGRLGIRARTINSANVEEWDEIDRALRANEVDLLLVSPERRFLAGVRYAPALAVAAAQCRALVPRARFAAMMTDLVASMVFRF